MGLLVVALLVAQDASRVVALLQGQPDIPHAPWIVVLAPQGLSGCRWKHGVHASKHAVGMGRCPSVSPAYWEISGIAVAHWLRSVCWMYVLGAHMLNAYIQVNPN